MTTLIDPDRVADVEWCPLCATSDDPATSGAPSRIDHVDFVLNSDDEVATLVCGHQFVRPGD